LCKKKVFRHESTADDSDSDNGNVENGSTSASERTPLLASVAISAVTTASGHGTCSFYVVEAEVVNEVIAYSTNFHVFTFVQHIMLNFELILYLLFAVYDKFIIGVMQ